MAADLEPMLTFAPPPRSAIRRATAVERRPADTGVVDQDVDRAELPAHGPHRQFDDDIALLGAAGLVLSQPLDMLT